MANSNGIFKRGSSYYLRVVLPLFHPLRYEYKSGKVVISLGACSYREALTAAAIKRARILETKESVSFIKRISNPSSKILPSYHLRDIYRSWAKSKPISNDAIKACLRALHLYEEQTNNPPLHLLTRAQGDSFRAWLQEPNRKTSSKTAYDRFTWIKTLLKFAHRDLEIISRNPWEGIELFKETTKQRRPWSNSELQTLFGQPLFQKYLLPKDQRAGKDASFWIPLLGLYTGARISELVQLKINDVYVKNEILVITISNSGENQQVKTSSSIRTIPVHSELINLGFAKYISDIKNTEANSLWPKLSQRKNKPGGYFSNWFGDYRASIGLKGYPDFHCLRHTVRSQLVEADVREDVIDSILGHQIRGSTGAKIYTHRTLKTLKNAIECLQYKIQIPPIK